MVLVGCTLVATSFTSCISNDDDNITLTEEEAARRLEIMQGSYRGKTYVYYNNEAEIKGDSIVTGFTMSIDSLFTVDFPVSLLANAVKDKTNTDLIEALKSVETKKVYFKMLLNDIYGKTDSNVYAFYLYPASYLNFTCSHGDQTYEVEVKFALTGYYFNALDVKSYGMYSKGEANAYLPIGSITVNKSEYTMTPVPFLVTGREQGNIFAN